MLVVCAFEEAFGFAPRLRGLGDLNGALDCLIADGEVRGSSAGFYSEDARARPARGQLLRGDRAHAACS